jgi:hypothetical protein
LTKAKRSEPYKLEPSKNGYVVNGLEWKTCVSKQDLIDVFRSGKDKRATHATDMNTYSSRSHMIFSVMVKSESAVGKKRNVGKLNLIDLAGSERASKTGSTGERFKEAKEINKSLFNLGIVMRDLADGKES